MIRYTAKGAWAPIFFSLALACGSEAERAQVAPGPSMSAEPAPLLEAATQSGASGEDNVEPMIRSLRFEPASPVAGQALRVIADTFDADGDAVGLSYVWSIQGNEVRGDSEQMTFPQLKKGELIEVTVTPTDGKVHGQPMSAETSVANQAPSFIALHMEPSTQIQAGTPIVAKPNSHDFDDDSVLYQYSWTVNGLPQPVKGDTLITTKLKRGDLVQVTVVATDGEAESPPARSEELEIQNSPPEIVSTPSSPDADGAFVYQLEVKDADDRHFTYKLARSPQGMEIDLVSGRIDWTPSADLAGSFPVEIVVDDRNGGRSRQSFELSIASQEEAASTQESPAALPN
jgi:hypothetical protein